MLVVPALDSLPWLYGTYETSNAPPQPLMEHIQDSVENGGFSHVENYRRYGGSSIGPVEYHRSVYGNSHIPYEYHSQAVFSLMYIFSSTDNDYSLSTEVESRGSEHESGGSAGDTYDSLSTVV